MMISAMFNFGRIVKSKEPRNWLHLAEPLDYIHLLFSFTTSILIRFKQISVAKMPFAVKALDHVVLTCRNIPATLKFYSGLLGMKHEVFRSSKDAPGVERYVYSLHENHHQTYILFSIQYIPITNTNQRLTPHLFTDTPYPLAPKN
jgi:hypothetical protein